MSVSISTILSTTYPHLHSASQSDAVFVTDASLTRMATDQIRRLAQRFGVFIRRSATTVLVTGQATYSAPPRHASTLHVTVDGRPLVASSSAELELRDQAYQTTQSTAAKPISRWYEDKIGSANRIGVQPVPRAADAGGILEVIYHEWPCSWEEPIDAPKLFGDYIELQLIGEAFSIESDFMQSESAQAARALAGLIEQATQTYYGVAQ